MFQIGSSHLYSVSTLEKKIPIYRLGLGDHPYITSAKYWVGGFRKRSFLLTFITVFMLTYVKALLRMNVLNDVTAASFLASFSQLAAVKKYIENCEVVTSLGTFVRCSDVSTGATGATEVAPKFSGTLTLSQPRRADSAHHRRGCT